MTPPVVRFGYEGGLSLDTGTRPARHTSLARRDMRRAARKRQRRAWRRVDVDTE